jgi:hypothetical protein
LYILWSFGLFLTVLVCRIKVNLATLVSSKKEEISKKEKFSTFQAICSSKLGRSDGKKPGVNVIILSFGDFRRFLANQIGVLLEN